MLEPSNDPDDLLSRISRNVEANLEDLQQRSAWISQTNEDHDWTTTNRQSPIVPVADRSSDFNIKSMDTQIWPSPVGDSQTNNYISVRDTLQTSETATQDGSKFLRFADMLSQHVLLHPFIALRRTCQVNRKCSSYICIQPFSLVPFMYHQQRKQGLASLYRGLSSELLVKGITLGTETAMMNYTDWPRRFWSNLTLRVISITLSTPFLCTSVIETVQSVIVVRDRPSFVDCLRNGFLRLLHLRSTPSNRMMPIWLLVVPTVCYHVLHESLWHTAKNFVNVLKKSLCTSTQTLPPWHQEELTMPLETSTEEKNIETDSNQISTCILASLITDVALLPVETVLHSLYIQGTRTIIDNCDETTVVLPVLTNYDGFMDCYQSILRFEGNMGLYKGLGAIILQYSIHFLIFRSLYYLLKEFDPDVKTLKKNRLSKEFTRIERHSTPNNSERSNNRAYRLNDTPRRYNRLI